MDCSVTMAWCFEDETSAYADEILQRLEREEAMVSSMWPLEVANVLLVGERRKRLTQAETRRFLTLLQALPIVVDSETTARAFQEIMAIGRDQGRSSYDASYLELALRRGLPLATLDDGVRQAGRALGITIL